MNNVTVNENDVLVSVVSDEITVTITDSVGIPAGGTANQVLKKNSSTDYDVSWASDVAGVPYTGATQDVNLGEFGLLTGNLEFDTTPTNAPTGAGSMVWNDTEGTVDLVLKGGNLVLPIGQKQTILAVNGTGGNLTRVQYRAVKITGAQGQRLQVSLARADNDANSKDTIGIVGEDISNNQTGFIVSSGLIEEINTTGSLQGETWADGDTLYLSGTTYGVITNVKPSAPTHTVILGFVVYAHANHGKIYVKVDNGYELDELHNVNVSTAASGDYLRYNGTTWVDATISVADLPTGIDADKIGSGLVSNTEFGYLDGVTSAIQTQLNAKQATLTLTTTGTSGAATLVGATLNIPQYQAVLTNPVTGTGTTNRLAKFTGSSTIGDGGIVDLRTTEGMRLTAAGRLLLGTTTESTYLLDVAGDIRNTTSAYFATSSGSVGVGTTNPLSIFEVNSTGPRIRVVGTTGQSVTQYVSTSGQMFVGIDTSTAALFGNGNYSRAIYSSGNYSLDIYTNDSIRIRIDASGNLGLGQTTFGTSATKTLAIGSGTAPSTSPADAFQLYSADITAGNAAPHFRTEGGAVVKLYQQTTGVGAAAFVANSGTAVNDASTFGGYTLKQIVQALQNAGFLA